MKGVRTRLRTGDWWSSKIPPLLTVAYGSMLVGNIDWHVALPAILRLLLAIVAVAGYGYILNDVFDIEEDQKRGKPNTMASLRPMHRGALLVLFAMLSFAPLIGGPFGIASTLLVAANLALPTLYSVPPIRLKERGIFGVFADAMGAQVVPALFFGVSMAELGGGATALRMQFFVVTATIWALLVGLRGIIVHQFRDRESDLEAGVQTFAGSLTSAAARKLIFGRIFPAELVAFSALLFVLVGSAPILVVIIPVFISAEFLKIVAGWKLPLLDPDEPESQPYVPIANNEFYEVWLPLALATQVALTAPQAIAVPLLHGVGFWPNVKVRLMDLAALSKALRKTVSRPKRPALPEAPDAFGDSPDETRNDRNRLRIFLGATCWSLNGVNVFSANMVRGLRERGHQAVILLTEENTDLVQNDAAGFSRPPDIPFVELPAPENASWGSHWGAMIRFLEVHAPCIYVPNSDYRHSCTIPMLSDRVGVVGVVHSDDPLHYDHVKRLGAQWDWITTTSRAIAERVRESLPQVAERLSTIPIGVVIPAECPDKTRPEGKPLRLIYHGMIKKYQKRILDLPAIVSAFAERGVSATLTVVGAGPDEHEFLDKSRHLIDQGLIDFRGLISHDQVGETLEQHDVYLLTSAFEGMPNALLEAMGRGCVPLVTRMESGIPELVHDGETGFMVPVGDIDAFVDRIDLLAKDDGLRRRLAVAAHAKVLAGPYNVDHMVDQYENVFKRVARGTFKRPGGPLNPPPAELDGVSVFPVKLGFHRDGVGDFPHVGEWRHFQRQMEQLRVRRLSTIPRVVASHRQRTVAAGIRRMNVIMASPNWVESGVNEYILRLVRELRGRGFHARILLTEECTDLVTDLSPRMGRPGDVPLDELPVKRSDGWGAHWGAQIRYLTSMAPCIYLPNNDWRHSCVSPLLPKNVFTIGGLLSNDPLYHDHLQRLASHWNAVITHDVEMANKALSLRPDISNRLYVLEYDEQPVGDSGTNGRPDNAQSATERMASEYIDVIGDVYNEARYGAFRREFGPIKPPPANVEGIDLFPLDLSFEMEGIGRFVDEADYLMFVERRDRGLEENS